MRFAKFYAWLFVAFVIALAPATQASSQTAREKGRFDVYFQGNKVGDLRFSAREKATTYTAEAKLRMKGEMAASFEAKVSGALENARYIPQKFSEKSKIAGRTNAATVTYQDGTPTVKQRGKAADHWLDPAAGQGLPDSATALWQLLQGGPTEALCDLDIQVFDGARQMTLRTLEPKPRGPSITCKGNFFRDAGYSEDEWALARAVTFEIEYAPAGAGSYRAERIDISLPQGRVILVRR